MQAELMPHWLAVLIGSGCLSMPFMLYSIFQCGALNPNATAPFTHYQGVTSGLNLSTIGAYVWLTEYAALGRMLLGLGVFLAVFSTSSLWRWYRQNPRYIRRLFGGASMKHPTDR